MCVWALLFLEEISPARRSASCPLGEASARLSAVPLAVPGHSVRCSSPLWPVGAAVSRCQMVVTDGKGSCGVPLAPTHVVGEDVGDGHEDCVLGSGRGQVQPELQVTDRVAAQVLQLHKTTHSNILNDLLLAFFSGVMSHILIIAWDIYIFWLHEMSSQAATSFTLR